MLKEVGDIIPTFDSVSGLSDLNLNVYGNIKDIAEVKYNTNVFTKGQINLLGNSFGLNGIKVNGIKGIIDFDGLNAGLNLDGLLGKSALNIKTTIKDKIADASISIPKLNLRDISDSEDNFQKENANIIINFNGKYKGKTDSIEYDKLDFSAKILESIN